MMTLPSEIMPAYLRELTAALEEARTAVTAALTNFLEDRGEVAAFSTETFEVRNFNAEQVLITGPLMTEQAATHLRGAGFEVLHVNETALARPRRRKGKKAPIKYASQAGGKRITELLFFNDDASIRIARKLWVELVEGQSYRFFPQFMKDLDNVIVSARRREGHDDDKDAADGTNPTPAELIDAKGGREAVASADDGFVYNARGEVVGCIEDLKPRPNKA